jgi:hypothetical protein
VRDEAAAVLGVGVLGVGVLVLAGCGGGSGSDGSPPAELVGTYTTTLEADDIPANAPPELEAGPWKLVIATSGAPDDGPSLGIDNPTKGNLEAPGLSVDGDTLTLEQEECAAGGTTAFYDNQYGWELTGSNLKLTTLENKCPDHVAETILTSRPWTKTS